jgi:hypothetical protein
MGKFLKILRYIANLIAIMGKCFSKEQKSNSSLNQRLLGGQTKRPDFKPDQGVSANNPEVKDFLSSHIKQTEFFSCNFKMYWTESCPKGTYVFQKRKGNFPLTFVDDKMKIVMSLKMVHYLSTKTTVIRTSTGFVVVIDGISYKLGDFDLLLSHQVSEGNFKRDLVKNNPYNYKKIWENLTSNSQLVVLYN